MQTYVELRAHSAFSFGDGSASPEALVRRAAELGYGALGLTDHADLGGVVRFVLEAERRGIRAIVGAEIPVDGHPTAFLARDERGYRNLAGLVTRARVGLLPGASRGASGEAGGGEEWQGAERARGRPGVAWAEVEERAEGLWALTGPAAGEIPSLLRARRPEEAIFALERWKAVFGERLVLEVQLHHVSGEESALASALIELAERGGVRWAVGNDVRYLDASGRLVHDLLVANQAGVDVSTAASWGLLLPNGEWRLKSPQEMALAWRGREAGLAATHEIALDCGFDLRWLRPPLPKFGVPRGHDDVSWLRELTWRGARERWGEPDERQRAQLEHELGVIGRLGFAGFFLVMWDAVNFARQKEILCQGRGSAANSAVAYCLGITAIDPVRHGLLFERFLSEVRTDGRTEAPDIDVDFEMHRREEVLDYMYARYARGHAAITAVTQAYHAPAAIQDCMRALGYPAERAFALSKRLHGAEPSAGAAALEQGMARDAGLDLAEPRGRALLSALRALDDVPRLRSTHPGGFVLSAEPLGDYLPIEQTTMGRTIVQLDKDDLDAAGVPKFDFLGLGGLSAVHLAFDAIAKWRSGRPTEAGRPIEGAQVGAFGVAGAAGAAGAAPEKLELYRLPTDDVATYEMISRGDTVGTFQIESRAQIQSILQTRPERLYDIVVQVALIRPGPIQAKFVRPYTRRRRGLEPVTYAHPLLEPILRRTYGIPIFQEQAMAISMALGGFSAAEADELRRAMGHIRKLDRLNAVLERLRRRIVQHTGVGDEVAAGIVEDLQSFANYGFPESHAWSFALIAYATAYLKRHFPAEFFLGLLNAWPMGFYPPATLVHDALRHGVVVRPPCLKAGAWDCTLEPVPEGGGTERAPGPRPGAAASRSGIEVAAGGMDPGAPALRIGWRHIRGLGEKTRERLRRAREEGPFGGVEDVVRRAGLTRAEVLHLARAGALEAFEPGRRRAAWRALRAAGDVLPLAPARVAPVAPALPFDPRELAGEELIFLDYLATGISVRGHPMQHVRARLDAAGVVSSAGLERCPQGGRVVIAGLVVARQHPATSKGTVFVLLEDEWGFLNVIVPARTYERNRETVKFAPFLVVEGTLERDERVVNVVGRRFRELDLRRAAGEPEPGSSPDTAAGGAGAERRAAFRSHDFH